MPLKDLFSKAPSPIPPNEEPWPQPDHSSSNSSSNSYRMSPLYSAAARPTVEEFLRTNYLMIPEFVLQVNRAKVAENKGSVDQSMALEESTSIQGTAHRRQIISFDSVTRDVNSDKIERKEDGNKEVKENDSTVQRRASGSKGMNMHRDNFAAQKQTSIRDIVVPPPLKPKPRVKKVMKGGSLVTIPAPQIRIRALHGSTADSGNNVESGALSEHCIYSEVGETTTDLCLPERSSQETVDQSCKDDPRSSQLAIGKHFLVTATPGSKDLPGEVSFHGEDVSGSEILPKNAEETQVPVTFGDSNVLQRDKNNTDKNYDFDVNRSYNTIALPEKESTNRKGIMDKKREETPTGPMQESNKAESNDEFTGNVPSEDSLALSTEYTSLSENQGEYFCDYQRLAINSFNDQKETQISESTDYNTMRVLDPLRSGSLLTQLKSPESSSAKKQESLSSELPIVTGSSIVKQSSDKLNVLVEEHSTKIKQNENFQQNHVSNNEKSQVTEISHEDQAVKGSTSKSSTKGTDSNADGRHLENFDAGNYNTGVFNESDDGKEHCATSIESITSDRNACDDDDQVNSGDDDDRDDIDEDGNNNAESASKGDNVADDGSDEYAELVMVESTSGEDEEEYDIFPADENYSDGEENDEKSVDENVSDEGDEKSDYEAEDKDLDSDTERDASGITFHQNTTIGQRVKYLRGRQKDDKRTMRNRRKKARKRKRAKEQKQASRVRNKTDDQKTKPTSNKKDVTVETKKLRSVSGHISTVTPSESSSETKSLAANDPPQVKLVEPGSLLSMVSSYTVDLTVAASEKLLKRKTRGGQHAKKLKKAKRKAEALERKRRGEPPSRTRPVYKELPKPICSFYIEGKCKKGSECCFRHDRSALAKKKAICKFYQLSADNCHLGDDCVFMHSSFPCKFFHTSKSCREGDRCRFSHDALTDETSRILQAFLNPPPEDTDQLSEGTDVETLKPRNSDSNLPIEDSMQSGHSSPYNLRASARKRALGYDGTTPEGQGTHGKMARLESPAKADKDTTPVVEEEMGPFVPGLYRDLCT